MLDHFIFTEGGRGREGEGRESRTGGEGRLDGGKIHR